jgi:hypothetical protein
MAFGRGVVYSISSSQRADMVVAGINLIIVILLIFY